LRNWAQSESQLETAGAAAQNPGLLGDLGDMLVAQRLGDLSPQQQPPIQGAVAMRP
jgi:hypothetical protein